MTKGHYVPGPLRLAAGPEPDEPTNICSPKLSARDASRRATAIALIRRELPLIEAGDHPILRATCLARQLLTILEVAP